VNWAVTPDKFHSLFEGFGFRYGILQQYSSVTRVQEGSNTWNCKGICLQVDNLNSYCKGPVPSTLSPPLPKTSLRQLFIFQKINNQERNELNHFSDPT
jgi:hypothetical protein